MKKLSLFILVLLLSSATVFGLTEEGHLKLLAVSEAGDNLTGTIADLNLRITENGKNRIFIETYPLTKFDTQVSTRFAKEIACDYLDIDCSSYDFFYSIRSGSPIVGGPSAGTALTVLTILMLKGYDIPENIAITGTINSGGLIGPVSGIKEKVTAAGKDGISTVLIPYGTANMTNDTDIINLGKELNISVFEVSTLDEALYYFTGKKVTDENRNISVFDFYTKTMKNLSDTLCRINNEAQTTLPMSFVRSNDALHLFTGAVNLTDKAKASYDNEHYYASASFCFAANVNLRLLILLSQNLSQEDITYYTKNLSEEILNFEHKIDNMGISNVNDLQGYIIVKERLLEAKENIKSVNLTLNSSLDDALMFLAYGIERFNSAVSWSLFIGINSKTISLNKDNLKDICFEKIAEAEERYHYVQFFVPEGVLDGREDLDSAYLFESEKSYPLCIFKATKAKAGYNSILNLYGVSVELIDSVIDTKFSLVKNILLKETDKEIFPILAYSYYEYASELRDKDKYSALLYLEYSQEFGNLDVYLNNDIRNNLSESRKKILFDFKVAIGYLLGTLFGIIITLSYLFFSGRIKQNYRD